MKQLKVCLVTEELGGVQGSGGIGAAFLELAICLAKFGHAVTILYCPAYPLAENEKKSISNDLASKNIDFSILQVGHYVLGPETYERKSYAVLKFLESVSTPYDFIHFHDYKGLGFFSTAAKRQGLAFQETKLVVQAHGPTRWAIEANGGFFTHEDQLKIDYLEKKSLEYADFVVSPSAYLVQWMQSNGYVLPRAENISVIKNVCSELKAQLQSSDIERRREGYQAHTIVLFARHEERKGFAVFCDALDILSKDLVKAGITVAFLGKPGLIGAQPSLVYLADRSKSWDFRIDIKTSLNRMEAAEYLNTLDSPVVVIPSPVENSPYTVLEAMMLGFPVISSIDGGGRELFQSDAYPGLTKISAKNLADTLRAAIECKLPPPVPSQKTEEIETDWLYFHLGSYEPRRVATSIHNQDSSKIVRKPAPKVTLAITHYERPQKLIGALTSAINQDYDNTEIIVVDDGSKSQATHAALEQVRIVLKRCGGRLISRSNGYLGAARNTAIANASGDYIIFLDDDDIAKPNLVSTLVHAIETCGDDAVGCLNIYMEESQRGSVLSGSAGAPATPTYIPLGGPLSLAPTENCFGSATAIFNLRSLKSIGGYTELYGVGYEDYELYIKLVQGGMKVSVAPYPLYYYEVGRLSMLTRTSMVTNQKRCFNAIDFDKNPQFWRDFVSLNVGKHVSVNSHNRQWWIYSQSSTKDERHAILQGSLDQLGVLGAALAIAQKEGCSTYSEALSSEYDRIRAGKDDGRGSPSMALPLEVEKRQQDDLDGILGLDGAAFVEAAYSLILKRQPDAEGAQHYLNQLYAGRSKLQILADIRRSSEAKRLNIAFPALDAKIARLNRKRIFSVVSGWGGKLR